MFVTQGDWLIRFLEFVLGQDPSGSKLLCVLRAGRTVGSVIKRDVWGLAIRYHTLLEHYLAEDDEAAEAGTSPVDSL